MAPEEGNLPARRQEELEAVEGEVVADADEELQNIVEQVQQLLAEGWLSFSMQDHLRAEKASNTATALLSRAEALTDDPEALVWIHAWKPFVSLWGPLARAAKFYMEGRFGKSVEEYRNVKAACSGGIAAIKEWQEQNPGKELDKDLIVAGQTLQGIAAMSDAGEQQIAADELGFQGKTAEYLEEIKKVSRVYRDGADMLPATGGDMITHISHISRVGASQSGKSAAYLSRIPGHYGQCVC